MRIASLGVAVLLSCAAAIPASAGDQAAYQAISAGDYARAEAKLESELRIHPGRPELLLNLAAIHARTGRIESARALYEQVLASDEVLMDLAESRTAGSHAIAQAGLSRLPVTLSAR